MTTRQDRAQLDTGELDEASVLARVRQGDRHAYGLLYEQHVAGARRVAQAILRRSGDTDDAVAEAFAAAFAAIRRGKGPTDGFGPYIKSCVRHECYRTLRRQGEAPREDADDTPAPGDEFERLEETTVLRAAFDSLPPRMQSVLWYAEVEGRSHAEIAGATGGSSQAIAQLAMRARRELTTNYLRAHLVAGPASTNECRDTRDRLAEIVRGTASRRVSTRTAAHLAACADCASAQQSLVAVNSRLRSTPLVALLTGLAAPALVQLGWKARLVALLGAPAANLTAATSLVVLSTAVGPAPSATLPFAESEPASAEVLVEASGAAAPPSVATTADPGADDDTGATPDAGEPASTTATTAATGPSGAAGTAGVPGAMVPDTVPAEASTPTTVAAPATAAPEPTPVTTTPATTPATTTPAPATTAAPATAGGLPPVSVAVDLPGVDVDASVGPGLDTNVGLDVTLPTLVPGGVSLPVPPVSVAVTVPALPPVTLPGGATVVPPIDTGIGVDVTTGSSGVGTSVGVGGLDVGLDVDINSGISLDLDLEPSCLPLLGRNC